MNIGTFDRWERYTTHVAAVFVGGTVDFLIGPNRSARPPGERAFNRAALLARIENGERYGFDSAEERRVLAMWPEDDPALRAMAESDGNS